MEIVDVDMTKLNRGLCHGNPTSCLVCQILCSIKARRILDLTFGEGRFYEKCRGEIELLVGVDPVVRKWCVKPDVFINKPLQHHKTYEILVKLKPFDVAIIDPPFFERMKRGYDKRVLYFEAFGKPKYLLEKGAEIAAMLGIKHVLVHFNERITTLGKYKAIRLFVYNVKGLGTEYKSYFVLFSV